MVQHGRPAQEPEQIKVWDAFVRFFHWGLAVLVVSLVLSAHFGWQEVHMALGVDLSALLAARLLWGMVGPRHARFANFVTGPRAGLRYLGDVLRGRPRRYLGHNPAGGLMVVTMLIVLSFMLVTGFVLQATLEFEGPLVEWLRPVDDRFVAATLALHRASVNALYVLVPLHLLGVVLASVQHRENLLRAMLTGYKRITTEG